MTQWLEKIRGNKGFLALLALGILAVLCLSWPAASSNSSSMTAQEQRISATLSAIAGAGETRVSIYYAQEDSTFSASQTPVGAVIVAAGANDVGVRLDLIQATQALLGLPAASIAVFPMEMH